MVIRANIELVDKKRDFSYVNEDYIIKGTTNKELIQEAKNILHGTYGIAANRTQPIFIDVPNGAIWTGFATSFWNKYEDNKRFNGEAWVTFSETKPIDLDNTISNKAKTELSEIESAVLSGYLAKTDLKKEEFSVVLYKILAKCRISE